MLKNENFEMISFEGIPLNQDLIVMDEKWVPDYDREWIKVFSGDKTANTNVGYVSYVAARSIGDEWLELSWYPNTYDRYHEVPVFLPRSAFITCVDLWRYDEKPRVFVKSGWLAEVHEHPLAAFAFVDAIGVKRLLQSGNIDGDSLRSLRDRVDEIAARYSNFAFISFADSMLVKQVWSVGHIDCDIKYTYSPEALLPVVAELRDAFKKSLGLPAYAIMTQGLNAYTDGMALHTSASGNHVSLNTLGLPFAQLMAIEEAARSAIRAKLHDPAELYLDAMFFRSLKFKSGFERNQVATHFYRSPMTKSPGAAYVAVSAREIADNLE